MEFGIELGRRAQTFHKQIEHSTNAEDQLRILRTMMNAPGST